MDVSNNGVNFDCLFEVSLFFLFLVWKLNILFETFSAAVKNKVGHAVA